MPPLLKYLVCVTPIFGQTIRLGQGDQVLMTVQFPRDLAIADLVEIEIANPVKGLLRSPFAVDQVEMPIDRISVFQIFIAEEVKLVAANLVGLTNDQFSLLRKPSAKQVQQRLYRIRREEKPARPGVCRANQPLRKIESESERKQHRHVWPTPADCDRGIRLDPSAPTGTRYSAAL